ncbi:xanthine dehydrogenase family protein molybdopterin-binding subunit [Olivibacter sp. SDN3]|uniref:xanthine dehydrogenase family protein molybdopterin-binding subunit n=1 Tax=Olivibacter sp. SDN3 TaxID=2764720 RepID=UPI001651A4B4|nr:molybdopterin cofactor-binding domain-containing protein [Olivibacter sp. SDN3]QNL49057.1 xanthine dehydrogenase family protein molybdopterin-binding subunit [Olivibacter sp. SDN3]
MGNTNQIEKKQLRKRERELLPLPVKNDLSRRKFLRILGGGVAVALTYTDVFAFSEGASKIHHPVDETSIAAWIHIDGEGRITVFTGKVEVGQNIRTSLAQVVAEELSVPMDTIEMIMGDTDLTPYDPGTFGSRTTPYMGPQLRIAAASMKEALIAMAAKQWKVDKQFLRAKDSSIINTKTGRSLHYGEITKGQKIVLPLNKNAAITSPNERAIVGTSVPKMNGKSYITGRHKYVSDMVLPDMVYGKVLRPPVYGASLLSVNTQAARLLPGVTVIERDGFIGITAVDPQTAENAMVKIEAQWSKPAHPSKTEIFEYLKSNSTEEGNPEDTETTFRNALSTSFIQVKQDFKVQYIAHVPLEPRAGVAKWEGEHLTVWTGTQRPFGVQEELEDAFKMPKRNVRVIMPDTGSGYGGKHSGEAGVEAARLSKAVGKPVKVIWSREEEFKWAYFRPAGFISVAAGVDGKGMLTSWEFRNYNSGNAGIEIPYEVQHKNIQFHPSKSPFRQGSYRGLAATANVFAIETIMNDIAVQLKRDPLEFRIAHLRDDRLTAVLKAAADKFGWGVFKKDGTNGQGISCGFVKNAYVATCVEVSYNRDTSELSIKRIVAAFECGTIINPKHLESQVMGCILQGLGGALFEEVDFDEGRILNPTLSTYRVPRFADIPPLEIVLLDRKDLPSSGAGETPIVGIAPAVRNAIHDATGKQLYDLPLIPNGLKI